MANPTDPLDPFAEGEVEYTGPEKAGDTADDDVFNVAYNLDENSDDDPFAFDDDPADNDPEQWMPPVTPSGDAQRDYSGADSGAGMEPRPAAHRPTQPTPTPRQVTIPTREDPTGARHSDRNAPGLPTRTRRSLLDRVKALFVGNRSGQSDEDMAVLRQPSKGTVNIVFVNRKGGVGKTVTTTLAGMVLAQARNDRVIAIDASPEGGELGDRVHREQDGSVRSLLARIQVGEGKRYSHVRTHTSQDQTGLEILGSDPNAIGEPDLTGDEYRQLMGVLRNNYSVILTDCAQGLGGSLMEAVLDEADVLVLVSEGADGMRSATWVASQLDADEGRFGGKYAHLVDDMIVVVTQRSPKTNVNMDAVVEFFQTMARSVVVLPYDQALEGGRTFTLEELSADTRDAGMNIAMGIVTSRGFQNGGR